MKKYVLANLIFATLFSATLASAGSLNNVKITSVFTTKDDGAFIQFSVPISGSPNCGKNNNYRLAVKPSTPGGKAHLAAAMLAFSQGKTVTVVGTGECSVWGDTESLQYLVVSQ